MQCPLVRYALLSLGLCLLAGGCTQPEDAYTDLQSARPFSQEALNFTVVGDWGRDGLYHQREVAREMGLAAAAMEGRFVISTGDNFYPDGVGSVYDPQWHSSYEAIYTHPALYVPWYVILGNHDYQGDIEAQMAYTSHSTRWYLPERYYAVRQPVDDTTEALFVFLDTVPLQDPDSAGTAQLRWLDRTLAAADAEWRFVVGHHPLYTADDRHGMDSLLIQLLQPILQRHGVQAYISGHAHSLQHLTPAGPVHYLISGAGSRTRPVDETARTRYALGTSGFMVASLLPETMHVRFIDYEGHLRYTARIPRVAGRP